MARGVRGRSARQRRARPPHPSLPHPRHSRPELPPAWPERGGHDLRERFSRWSGTRLVGHTKVNMSGSLRPAIDSGTRDVTPRPQSEPGVIVIDHPANTVIIDLNTGEVEVVPKPIQ